MRHLTILVDDCEEMILNKSRVGRCISAALLISHGVRRDCSLTLFFRKEKLSVLFNGSTIRNLRPDEQSMSGILSKIHSRVRGWEEWLEKPRRLHRGITLKEADLREVLRKPPGSQIFYCWNRGQAIETLSFPKHPIILGVFSLDQKYRRKEIEMLKDKKAVPIRISDQPLDLDALIVLFNIALDKVIL